MNTTAFLCRGADQRILGSTHSEGDEELAVKMRGTPVVHNCTDTVNVLLLFLLLLFKILIIITTLELLLVVAGLGCDRERCHAPLDWARPIITIIVTIIIVFMIIVIIGSWVGVGVAMARVNNFNNECARACVTACKRYVVNLNLT